VGLLPNYMGNSEVVHFHLGAGRLVEQDLVRIHKSIKDKSFFKNQVLINAMKNAKNKSLHLLGLISDAGVHSHINHLFALLEMAHIFKLKSVFVHCITDGRDTLPKEALKYVNQIGKKLKTYNKDWKIATILGRFYAMDRDNRWNREHKAYDAMVNCNGFHYNSAVEAVKEAYKRNETDEFIKPSIVGGLACNVKENDSIIFFNFRSDRARQLTKAFVQGQFNHFKRKQLKKLNFVCLTQYDKDIKAPVAFEPIHLHDTLGEVLSRNKLKQFRLAETEKWAHVTYFFNGLSGHIYKGEERLLIPSPKVDTYDKTPGMSALKIVKKAVEVIKKGKHYFLLVNFANADMVGHTGDYNATLKGVEIVDQCIGQIYDACKKNDWCLIVTADHGNAEEKIGKHGEVLTAHSTNKVPLIITEKCQKINNGALYDVAPTVLKIMGLKKPKIMEHGF
ncbi:2,3-bisphosphoglycerate-independent phosphoglycerate mutase, partial [archaeon]|nr:2,3-bisphosphoglycerate-independent phosphoglycerate mutase [archaeon]